MVERLSRSQIYQDYEQAYSQTTGLPLAFRPVEVWQLVHQGKQNQNPFCALMGQNSNSCTACLQLQRRIAESANADPQIVVCFAGLAEAAVPVRMGEQLVGFLQTGQVFLRKPSAGDFKRVTRQFLGWGFRVNLSRLEEAYFHSRVLSPAQLDSMVRLLSIFAQHLSIVGNQVVVQQEHAEPPNIVRAKQYIREHQANDLSLGEVARAVNTSTFYFCKMFKKATGLNFTDYLSRVRIEKAKNLLINPNLRVSEIAYEVGFQSLTHFNRVFRKMVGQSPTEYRAHLPYL
ncbi:MAG: helix-turn-helix domain-containing protein [Candidatus Omnitrophica bacterium]|nr:helix-turn-helix domain-containing protein [Candidatus Omnitrophota bacterium]